MTSSWNWPKHPFRITAALALAGISGAIGPTSLPLQIVFISGALKLLWEL